MEKVVRLGTVNGKTSGNVFCKIEYEEKKLSITGVIGPRRGGDCHGGCGQINMSLKAEDIEPASGWDAEKIQQFLDYWELYHLNDMQAGCEHQREAGWEGYDVLGKPCPVCGYKYGTSWLFMEVPEDVINWLFNLPVADVWPAWV